MTFFAERKCRPKEQEPQTTSAGKAYMRTNLEAKIQMVSPVPVMIAPTDQGLYQLPIWTMHLTSTRLDFV